MARQLPETSGAISGTGIGADAQSEREEIARLKQTIDALTDRAERAEREMAALQQNLAEQSVRDVLTGLYNRRYMEEAFRRELIVAERHDHPVSVIVADIDHFQMINDHYGHLAGDEVLRAFGGLLNRNARGSDIECRYGGEKFLLVLPQMAPEKATERAEQLRRTLSAAPIRYGATSIPVTASFGVAGFPLHGPSGDRVVAAAERALHDAKQGGRNSVRLSAPPPA